MTASETYALAFEFGPIAAPALTQQQIVGGSFQTTITGEPTQLYAVDATADLLLWTPVITNKTSSLGIFQFIQAAGSPSRLFRLREVW